ncbi:MAG: hypothetical protein NTW86_12695, partial [Candidatus Sumerlaeota bacterium]|nr:hypothetical protein [Candidatus Sumerlaeota bacterium]
VNDAGDVQRAMRQTMLVEALQSNDLASWRESVLPPFAAQLQGAVDVDVQSLLDQLHGEWVVAVARPATSVGPAPETPGVALLVRQPSQGAERFDRFLNDEVFRAWPALKERYFRQQDLFLFCNDPNLGDDLARRMISAPAEPRLPALAEAWDPTAHIGAWLDLREILAPFLEESEEPLDSRLQTGLEVSGAAALDTARARLQIADQGFHLSGRLDFSEPRSGVFDVLADDGAQPALLLAPQGTAALLSLALRDPADLWRSLNGFLPAVLSDEDLAKLDDLLKAMGETAGASIPDSLLQTLDGRVALAVGNAPTVPLFAIASFGIKDADAARQWVDKQAFALLGVFGMVRSGTYRGAAYDVFSPTDFDLAPTYGLVGDSLVVASDTPAFRLAVDALEGKASLADDPRCAQAAGKLDLDGAAALFYADPARLIRPAWGIAMPFLAERFPDPGALPEILSGIPDPDLLAGQLAPTMAVVKTEEKALTFDSFSEGAALGEAALVAPALASALTPEFRSKQVAATLDRVDQDMETLAVALEAYRVDNGAYPPSTADMAGRAGAEGAVEELGVQQLGQIRPEASGALSDADTPTFYTPPPSGKETAAKTASLLRNPPLDPFSQGRAYGYYTVDDGWLIYSCGPDGRYDLKPREDFTPENNWDSTSLILRAYDPTNGTDSGGDIWRTLH